MPVAPIRYEQKDETAAPVSDSVAQSLLSRVVYEDEGLLVTSPEVSRSMR
jgi:23S rRNA pseudouridine955/2504/2580 synthase